MKLRQISQIHQHVPPNPNAVGTPWVFARNYQKER